MSYIDLVSRRSNYELKLNSFQSDKAMAWHVKGILGSLQLLARHTDIMKNVDFKTF